MNVRNNETRTIRNNPNLPVVDINPITRSIEINYDIKSNSSDRVTGERDLDPPRGRNINRRGKVSRCTIVSLWRGASSLSPANVLDRRRVSPPPTSPLSSVLLSRRSFIIYVLIYYNRSSAAFDPYRALWPSSLSLSLSLFYPFYLSVHLARRDTENRKRSKFPSRCDFVGMRVAPMIN